MGNNLKFNSSVCTTREQSQRLLELGLKPETADMYHTTFYRDNVGYEIIQVRNEKLPLLSQELPAWSLHRLLELCPDCQAEVGNRYATFYYQEWSMDVEDFQVFENAYDNIIECIMWLISKGYFNKEYLKQ